MSVTALHNQLTLQKISHASPLTHVSSLNAQIRLAQFIEREATILARRTLMPSTWLLQKTLNDPVTNSHSDIAEVLKSALQFEPTFGAVTAEKHTIKPPLTTSRQAGLVLDVPSDLDVLCGRGGKSNHHAGNKRYRQVVSDMKTRYRSIGSKTAKTHLSRAIVEHVHGYGGRFLRFDKDTRKYIVLSAAESRKKTSQALREAKEVKWTK